MHRIALGLALLSCIAAPAPGQITVPNADDSDGPFVFTADVGNPNVMTIKLYEAGTDPNWQSQPSPVAGRGVYDPNRWAVVFRYTNVTIPAGKTVQFANHPSGAPVVWLVSGNVTIAGTVNLDAVAGASTFVLGFAIPGPGGFRGAGSNSGTLGLTAGLGPGGGNAPSGVTGHSQLDGDFAARAYGNSRIVPLIGGSGAGKGMNGAYSTGGGGAILIASQQDITINGAITANFTQITTSDAYGSGGSIRLICDSLMGSGALRAVGNPTSPFSPPSSHGRIRVEANTTSFGDVGIPAISQGLPTATAQIWPEDVMTEPPSVRVVSLGASNVPADPMASFEFPFADVNTATSAAQTLTVECKNVPIDVGVQWNLTARIVPRSGTVQTITGPWNISGTFAESTWTTQVTLPTGFSAIQVRASMPPQ